MKTRIFVSLVLLAVWGFLNRGIFQPIDTIAKNTLAVSTVNGGNAAYVSQQAYGASTDLLAFVSGIALIFILIAIWVKPFNKNFKKFFN
jgi:uncharacterized membrane protein YjgN (DUF898 family)